MMGRGAGGAIQTILCDTSIATGATLAALAAVAGTSLTVPAEIPNGKPHFAGVRAFGQNLHRFTLHNTSWNPDPVINAMGFSPNATGMGQGVIWNQPPLPLVPTSIFTMYATQDSGGAEDANGMIYVFFPSPKGIVSVRPVLTGNGMILNLPEGILRVFRATITTPTANVFSDMSAIASATTLLPDKKYAILSAYGHSETAGALRFLRIGSAELSQQFQPVFPGRGDVSIGNLPLMDGILPVCPVVSGALDIVPACYNASAEATTAYVLAWEH